ncbi:hypothetical protein [Actibacterium sp. 188UL27-1]|uniref:hypothetical protein n=1 Tax=Actibacterium sp. 188UL27-1 TaxID=2786961 RepID=UPI00195CB070|nr:hypothetical protein [Actibacterium sp. 188UL27-1]MBM7066949.1 hypothetical protein [Actibacterium sp. 188UL27-1]
MSILRRALSGATLIAFGGWACVGITQSTALVTLQSAGGDITLTGQLVSAIDEKFTIATPDLGNIRVQAKDFICLGPACPSDTDQFAINDMARTAPKLLTGLLEGYASAIGVDYNKVTTDREVAVHLVNPDGTVRTRVNLTSGGNGLDPGVETSAAIGLAAWRIHPAPSAW